MGHARRHQKLTAHHEAGHAVMARELRRRVTSVTIRADGDTLGCCRHTQLRNFAPDYQPHRGHIEREVMILLAGDLAEGLAAGSTRKILPGSTDDTHKAIDLLSYLCGGEDEAGAYFDFLRERTKNRVRQAWNAVDAIANGLLQEETLSGKRVRQLYDEHRWSKRLARPRLGFP